MYTQTHRHLNLSQGCTEKCWESSEGSPFEWDLWDFWDSMTIRVSIQSWNCWPIWRIWISQEIIYMYRRFLHRHMFCSCFSPKDADACLENDARYCFLCSDVFLSWAVVLNCCCWQQGRRIFIPLPGTVPSHDGGTGGGLQARQRKELAGWVSAQTFSATLSLRIRHSITTCLNGVFA